MLTTANLHNYQRKAIKFALKQKRCALFLEMGLGKTAIALTTIAVAIKKTKLSKCLIIAPKRVCDNVWKQEAQKWEHLKDLTFSICTGRANKRLKALEEDSDLKVINVDNVKWLVDTLGKKAKFDIIIIDESSKFKSHSSQRFKALRSIISYPQLVMLLSATPASNSYHDLWSQMFLIDRGERLEKTITKFRNKYFTKDHWGYSWEIKPQSVEHIQNQIKDISLYMSAEDYLELPERLDLNINITLPDNNMKQYKQFKARFILEMIESDIEAQSAATLANKLLQFSSGAVYDDDGVYHVLHDEKLKALAELIDENPSENFLIAYNFKSDLERLQSYFSNAVLLNEETITQWNAGKVKLLLAHPASAGHGLNLQTGGSIVVWFSIPWSLENYKQFNGRLHRQGQTKTVRVIHLVCNNTIDERVASVLATKDANQQDLLDCLK